MRRESRRRVTVVAVALIAALALIAAACTNAEADSAPTAPADTTTTATVEITTTTVAPTSTTTTEPTTTTSVFAGAVGSPDALAELVDEANANSRLAYGAEIAVDLIPDLTEADPAGAARGIFELEAVIVQTAPVNDWLDVLVYPGSPIEFQYLSDLQTLSTNRLVAVVKGGGYIIRHAQLASPSEAEDVPREVREQLPEGSATVVVTSSSGPINYVDPDGVVTISNDGWAQRSRLVVVSPTESGWKLYWTEDV